MIYVGTTTKGIIEFRKWEEVIRYAKKQIN